ncbi:MAG: hypothetical protein NT027_18360, partial [Proteobacteria bacterium]|nr:hypothetical protein [Pseudomonadota bacterium]
MNKRNLLVAIRVVLYFTFTCKAAASESRRTMPRQTEVIDSKVKNPSVVPPIQKILDYTSSLHGLYKIEVPKEFQPLQSVQKVSINSELANSLPLKVGPGVLFVGQRHKLYWVKDRAIQFTYKLKSPLTSQPAILTDGTV